MRRPRPFPYIAAAAVLFAAVLAPSLRALAPDDLGHAPMTSPASTQAGTTDGGNYVCPGSCSAVACHGAIRPVAGARILQTEYSTWVSQDRHARATEVPGNMVSQRMGRI